jgi:hypothetical protein
VFRLLFLLLLLATAFVLIEPRWSPETRTLTLRVRTSEDLFGVVQSTARSLGDKAVERVVGAVNAPPPVASAPPESAVTHTGESHSDADRARLERLVQEKTREP